MRWVLGCGERRIGGLRDGDPCLLSTVRESKGKVMRADIVVLDERVEEELVGVLAGGDHFG